jgi:hypothetical protein
MSPSLDGSMTPLYTYFSSSCGCVGIRKLRLLQSMQELKTKSMQTRIKALLTSRDLLIASMPIAGAPQTDSPMVKLLLAGA